MNVYLVEVYLRDNKKHTPMKWRWIFFIRFISQTLLHSHQFQETRRPRCTNTMTTWSYVEQVRNLRLGRKGTGWLHAMGRSSSWFEKCLERLHWRALSILRASFDSPPKTIWKGKSGKPKELSQVALTPEKVLESLSWGYIEGAWVKNHKHKIWNPKVFWQTWFYTNLFDIRETILLHLVGNSR